MPRLVGVDIPNDKRLVISLTYIYGVGDHTAARICRELNIDPNMRAKDITEEEVARIAGFLDRQVPTEGGLRRKIAMDIQRLKEIGCYRGSRHRRSLPVRGQRTRTNARTRKGPKKTVAGKKSVKAK
ncbi:MAG: 30S ribosomal protein S13 [Planctomycetes bacterium]|nr:30S ribosomal protein S13 [Planctomycetota bacterium]MCC7169158.1 30S ribosomal protein S13 [Planctomycetota bacterium]